MSYSDIPILPELTFDNLGEIMYRQKGETSSERTVIPMLWHGFARMQISAGGRKRSACIYVPQGTPQGSMFVLLNIPSGYETETFLRKSGWLHQADLHHICLFAAEPEQGSWGADAEELPYLQACLEAEHTGVYFRGGLCVYAAGYGRTGTLLHRVVLLNPLRIAAAAFVNASPAEDPELENCRQMTFSRPGRLYTQKIADIPVPVLHMEASSDADEEITKKVSSFLMQYARYGADGPGANLLCPHVSFDQPSIRFRYFTDRNGIRREFLEYIPEAVQKSGKKAPLVLAFHGISESVRNYFELSQWQSIADREGFVLVMPEAQLIRIPLWLTGGIAKADRAGWFVTEPERRHTDLEYVEELLDLLETDSPVDPRRFYCTGHSMGCMMTNYIATERFSSRFAAFGATSGILWEGSPVHLSSTEIPMFMTMGEYDLWDYDPDRPGPLSESLAFWKTHNHLCDKTDADHPDTGCAREETEDGRYHHIIWNNKAGVPLLRYTWVQGKEHMNTPAENSLLWYTWFSHWELDENGKRRYIP